LDVNDRDLKQANEEIRDLLRQVRHNLSKLTVEGETDAPLSQDTLEIDTSDPAEWPADPEEWPRDLVVRDIDDGGEAVYTRVLTGGVDDE
jgi:hypothetical protein